MSWQPEPVAYIGRNRSAYYAGYFDAYYGYDFSCGDEQASELLAYKAGWDAGLADRANKQVAED